MTELSSASFLYKISISVETQMCCGCMWSLQISQFLHRTIIFYHLTSVSLVAQPLNLRTHYLIPMPSEYSPTSTQLPKDRHVSSLHLSPSSPTCPMNHQALLLYHLTTSKICHCHDPSSGHPLPSLDTAAASSLSPPRSLTPPCRPLLWLWPPT